jgi:hypothetical protein
MEDYKLHTILFDKRKNSLQDVIQFILKHNYQIKKIHEQKNFYRVRQLSKEQLKKTGYDDYRTVVIDPKKNIQLILGYKRKINNKLKFA